MENNDETIRLIFPPEEENITWSKREPRKLYVENDSAKVREKKPIFNLDIKSEASKKVDCKFCKKMIESSEYGKHLQEEHSLEYLATDSRKSSENLNGKTARGNEIQNILSNLQTETKRKDLNPIEMENLRKTLLTLKKEMTDEIKKFSKFDSIPVRLDQVLNYLERLKEKEQPVVKKASENSKLKAQAKIEETNKIKNGKMKIIWKFGL